MFENKVFSQVSSEFVSPLFPSQGEPVDLGIGFSRDLAVQECLCVTNRNGVQWRYQPSSSVDGMYTFHVEGAWAPEVLRYYFVFRIDGRYFYFAKGGVTAFPPQAKNHFVIHPSYDSPRWIASSYCYQIFPDRFCNGDESNDVHDGDYTYFGDRVTAHTFDEIPGPYEATSRA